MFASTTQENLINLNNGIEKELSSNERLLRSLSTLDIDEFHTLIQQQYGAYWGTLKFEDSLSDYSNEVNFIILPFIIILFNLFRLDHFFMLIILLIYILYVTL
jgi:hypothetical protein